MGDLKPVISMLHNPVETAEELDMLTKKAARSVVNGDVVLGLHFIGDNGDIVA